MCSAVVNYGVRNSSSGSFSFREKVGVSGQEQNLQQTPKPMASIFTIFRWKESLDTSRIAGY